MAKKPTQTIHRDARTGRIVTEAETIRRPATTTTEHRPAPSKPKPGKK